MIKKRYYLWGVLLLSFNIHAKSCEHDLDCHGTWEQENCLCGVHASCNLKTDKNVGQCKCVGKEASCHTPSEASQKLQIRSANPMQRSRHTNDN